LSGELINCRKIAASIRKDAEELRIKNNINSIKIVVFLLSDDDASLFYAENIKKDGEKRDFEVEIIRSSPDDFLKEYNNANNDPEINGIMLQFPIPSEYPVNTILKTLKPDKDIDGIGFSTVSSLYYGRKRLNPSTAEAVVEIIKRSCDISIGEKMTIIGRSKIVGLPLFHLLLQENYTPQICHSKTKDLENITKNSSVLISAVGKPHFLKKEDVALDSVLIDVGTNLLNGKWVGDFDTQDCIESAKYITPVPRGVGTVTRSILYRNIIRACVWQEKN